MDVLREQDKNGLWSGYTGNYIRVFFKSPLIKANVISSVKLDKLYRDGIWAITVPENSICSGEL
jgi:hypothetical protein